MPASTASATLLLSEAYLQESLSAKSPSNQHATTANQQASPHPLSKNTPHNTVLHAAAPKDPQRKLTTHLQIHPENRTKPFPALTKKTP